MYERVATVSGFTKVSGNRFQLVLTDTDDTLDTMSNIYSSYDFQVEIFTPIDHPVARGMNTSVSKFF